MHSDLSAHLHSDECNVLARKLQECHAEHSFAKFLGICNEADAGLIRCLRKERENRTRANRLKAAEKRQKLLEAATAN